MLNDNVRPFLNKFTSINVDIFADTFLGVAVRRYGAVMINAACRRIENAVTLVPQTET